MSNKKPSAYNSDKPYPQLDRKAADRRAPAKESFFCKIIGTTSDFMKKRRQFYQLVERGLSPLRLPYPSMFPCKGYPSSTIDSEGCEFGMEMYYHIPYAYHLHQQGLLAKTISCHDTRCFYWFSPDHEERYGYRQHVWEYPCIDQISHHAPAVERWQAPDFRTHYQARQRFDFDRPLLLIFNKYHREWGKQPVNFFSQETLIKIAAEMQGRFQVVYIRPTSGMVTKPYEYLDLEEKDSLRKLGVVMVETLHEQYPHLTFNELQLCLLANSNLRIAVQGGSAYLNSLFPGNVLVLHRHGFEVASNTYYHLRQLKVNSLRVHDCEQSLYNQLHQVVSEFTPDRCVSAA